MRSLPKSLSLPQTLKLDQSAGVPVVGSDGPKLPPGFTFTTFQGERVTYYGYPVIDNGSLLYALVEDMP